MVSDATHTSLHAALERVTLQAESGYLSQAFAALTQHDVSESQALVRVTDLQLQAAISGHPDAKVNSDPVDLLNLTPAQLLLLQAPGTVNVLDDGNGNYYLSKAAAERLATSVANAITALQDAELALPPGQAVVTVRGGQALDFIEDRLGMTLGVLNDAQGQPLNTADVDGATLSHAQRQWLHDHPGLVVQDRNGHLLMSTQTFENISQSGARQLAQTDEQIAELLADALTEAPAYTFTVGADTHTVVTLDGPASGWADLLRTLQLPLETQVLATTNGVTDYTALLNSQGPLLGIDAQGQLVLNAALRDALLPEIQAIGLRTGAIAAAGPGLIGLPALADGFAGEAFTHPASAYYETAGGAFGWARWYGVATGARAFLSSDMYIEGKYGAKYQELIQSYLDEPLSLINLYDQAWKTKTPISRELLMLAYLDDPQHMMTPRSVSRVAGITNANEINDFAIELGELKRTSTVATLHANRLENWNNPLDSSFEAASQAKTDALAAIRKLEVDPGNAQLLANFETLVNSYSDEMEKIFNTVRDLNQIVTDAGLDELISRATLAANSLTITVGLNRIGTIDATDAAQHDQLKEIITEVNTAARETYAELRNGMQQLTSLPDKKRAELRAELLASINVEKLENDKITDTAHALQQQRLVASLGRLIFQVESQAVDATLQFKKAGSLLGESPEADALANQYYAAGGATAFAAAASFFSALQVPVASYRSWVDDKPGHWDLAFFRKHFTNTNILNAAFVGPGVLWDHGADLPMRALMKGRLFKAIQDGLILSSETNQATGWIYFLSNTFGVFGGTAQMAQGFYTPSQYGNYLIARGGFTSLASFPPLLADAFGWLSKNPALINKGAYLNALGHVGLQMIVPLMDAIAYSVLHLGWGESSGVSLGLAINSIVNAAMFGVGLGVISVNWPIALSLMMAANIDFNAVVAAVGDRVNYNALANEGRNVEADVANAQFWRNFLKSFPVADNAAWIWGANDLRVGTPTELSRSNYEQAVRERVDALEKGDAATGKPSQQTLELAKALDSEGLFYSVRGMVDDFPYQINDGIRVIKSVVVNEVRDGVANTQAGVHFYDGTVNINGAANNFRNEAVITVALPNLTGGLATYRIAPEVSAQLALITDPVRGPNMLIDTSGSSVDSSNRFLIYNARVAIIGGAGDDEYLLMQALTPEMNSQGKTVSGQIKDGWSGSGRDVVNFGYAAGSHAIHTGASYNGLIAYDGIRYFIGSAQNDLITRYAQQRSDTRLVIDAGIGVDSDVIDLRGGNNMVMLANGIVRLDQSDLSEAEQNAVLLGLPFNADQEWARGPWKDDRTAYERIFNNTFDATNSNVINVMAAPTAQQQVEVYGNTLSKDTVAFSLLDTGVNLVFDAGTSRYQFASFGQGQAGSNMGFANNDIDAVIGSSFADRIVIDDTTAKIRQVQGNGGDDFIQVNSRDVKIETNDGRSNVLLGNGAAAAQVFAGVGTQVVVDTEVTTPTANDKITVLIKHQLPGVAPENGITRVDAASSNVALHVRANAGSVEIDLGDGDATIEIGENVRQIVVRDTSPSIGTLQLLFRNGDQSFDLLGDLEAVDGTPGRFSRDATNAQAFESVWTSASGQRVGIRIEADDASLDDISIGGAFAAATTYEKLDQLVAA